jgi:hypothetical protein
MNELIIKLPLELQEKIYKLDDTYKPSFDNKKWFNIHMELIEKNKYYWYRRYPVQAPKILWGYETDDEFDESDEEEDLMLLDQYFFN